MLIIISMDVGTATQLVPCLLKERRHYQKIEFGRFFTTCLTQLTKFNCPFSDYLTNSNFFESVKLPAVIL